jgi:hypothetical protein
MSGEEASSVRIMRQMEMVERIKHENELLKMNMTNEARAKKSSLHVQRYQSIFKN